MRGADRTAIAIAPTVALAIILTTATIIIPSSPNISSGVPHNGEDWPMFHATPDHRGCTTSWVPESNAVAWTLQYDGGRQDARKYTFHSAIVEGDNIYANGEDLYPGPRIPEDTPYTIIALDFRGGAVLWNHEYNPGHGFVPDIPAAQDGRIWVGNSLVTLVLSALNGTVIAEVPGSVGAGNTGYGVTITPAVMYVAPQYGPSRIEAYNTSSFELLWSANIDSHSFGAPSVSGDYLMAVSSNGSLYRIRTDNGSIVWSVPTGSRSFQTAAISQGIVVAGFEDGSVRAFEFESGRAIWKYSTGASVRSSPAISSSTVYIGSDDGYIYALGLDNGAARWRFPTAGPVRSSPAVAPNAVVFGSLDHKVYAINPDTGDLIWSYETGGEVWGSPAIARGRVLIGSSDGRLYAFGSNE